MDTGRTKGGMTAVQGSLPLRRNLGASPPARGGTPAPRPQSALLAI
ncbi:MAG: hypothetical protein WCA35_27435 [Kovacikia sp.]